MKKEVPKSVDEYISGLPLVQGKTLAAVRRSIKSAVPGCQEVISYQIPTFKSGSPVAAIAGFKNHCSYFTMSHSVMKTFEKELKPYHTSGVTIHFPVDKPLPAALVKKMVKAKLKENESKNASGKKTKTLIPQEQSEAGKVTLYMKNLQHPLIDEVNAVRKIIKNSSSKLKERIKWNAPSYYYTEDLVTFNTRTHKQVHLVFHHPCIVKIKSDLLKGNYKDRRMIYLDGMKEIKKAKKELERIMNELVQMTG